MGLPSCGKALIQRYLMLGELLLLTGREKEMIYPVPTSLSHTTIELHPSAIPCEFIRFNVLPAFPVHTIFLLSFYSCLVLVSKAVRSISA
jgi:hypothetical protein